MPQGESEPLLPRYEENASLNRRLQHKLHTYQIVRALSEGYMPSTEQIIINLRKLLASDLLSSCHQDIGSVGRQLIRDLRLWIQVFIDFLREKNGDDRLQDFLWLLSHSKASVNFSQVSQRASHAKARADTKAGISNIYFLFNVSCIEIDCLCCSIR